MVRDEEFLKGMWEKVEILEKEELERERVLQRNKEIKKKQLIIFISFAIVFIGFLSASLFISLDAIVVNLLFIVIIVAGIKLEFGEMKNQMKVS